MFLFFLLLESYGNYVYSFSETVKKFSKTATPLYSITHNIWKLQLFHILTNFYFLFLKLQTV